MRNRRKISGKVPFDNATSCSRSTVGKIPQSIRQRIIYGMTSFNIDEAKASRKALYLHQYSPKK